MLRRWIWRCWLHTYRWMMTSSWPSSAVCQRKKTTILPLSAHYPLHPQPARKGAPEYPPPQQNQSQIKWWIKYFWRGLRGSVLLGCIIWPDRKGHCLCCGRGRQGGSLLKAFLFQVPSPRWRGGFQPAESAQETEKRSFLYRRGTSQLYISPGEWTRKRRNS